MIGVILICFQIIELIRIFTPSRFIYSIPRWKHVLRPSAFALERATKLAAANKVERMIQNALVIHESTSTPIRSGLSSNTAMASTLLVYQVKEHDVEPCGGIIWAWKKIYNGTIYNDEGVWLHARLIASNIAQLFVAATFCVGWGILYFKVLNSNDTSPTFSPTVAPSPFPTLSTHPSAAPSVALSIDHPSSTPLTASPTSTSSSSFSNFSIRAGE
jgi:hypothetical protein